MAAESLQFDWRFCHKCSSLWFSRAASNYPAGGNLTVDGSGPILYITL